MKKGFYCGSFDPFTEGHLHVVTKAANLFDELVVGIGVNAEKKRRFDAQEIKKAIEAVISRIGLTNVKVIFYDNLTVDAALSEGADVLVRGIRNGMDYAQEEKIASINEEISGLDTIYIRSGKMGYISSSMVMELMEYGRDVSKYLPKEIFELVTK